jgi:hypothetical protein
MAGHSVHQYNMKIWQAIKAKELGDGTHDSAVFVVVVHSFSFLFF